MTEPGLFDLDPAWSTTPAEETPRTQGQMISAGRRLTKRIKRQLREGRHPLTDRPLHTEAAPADDPKAPGRRCGNCRFRSSDAIGGVAGTYPKCMFGWGGDPRHPPPRVSRGPGTDCRAWWPACRDHQPSTGGSGADGQPVGEGDHGGVGDDLQPFDRPAGGVVGGAPEDHDGGADG